MALTEVNTAYDPPKKGGGLMGSIAGTIGGAVVGGALAPFTGGASLAIIPGLAGAGGAIGSVVGNKVDPAKAGEAIPTAPEIQTDTSKLNSMRMAPEVQLAQMQHSKNLLSTSDIPQASDYMDMINQAQAKLKSQLGNNSFLG
jgi:uncharacterized protein YcfJ